MRRTSTPHSSRAFIHNPEAVPALHASSFRAKREILVIRGEGLTISPHVPRCSAFPICLSSRRCPIRPYGAPSPRGEGFVSAASRHSAFPPGSLYTLYRKLPFSPAKFPPPCRWKFHSFCAIIGILIGKRRGGGQTRPRALPTERVVNNNGTSIEGRRVLWRRFQ